MSLEREIAVMIAEALDLEDISFDDADSRASIFEGVFYLHPVTRAAATVEVFNNKNIL
jgi:hypothetical protein